MKMTVPLLIGGSFFLFWCSLFVGALLPALTIPSEPSDLWRPLTEEEAAGHRLWVRNGCTYCHSAFVRVVDWGLGAERIAEAGDYHDWRPAILGTERTGPDLSQAGGEHPDDWHVAHFVNPRFTRPVSVMPSWAFLGDEAIRQLTAFIQARGLRDADQRMARQRAWGAEALAAWQAGPDVNIPWLHAQVPEVWREMPNPYPPLAANLVRGRLVYQQFCTGCHGAMGDGAGPAAPWLAPPPLNFTTLRGFLVEGTYIGGIFYYQVMNGITGTAMPYFKRELESAKIWDVSNYVAVAFVGYTDATLEPRGIPAAYEPPWDNDYAIPDPAGPPPPAGSGPDPWDGGIRVPVQPGHTLREVLQPVEVHGSQPGPEPPDVWEEATP